MNTPPRPALKSLPSTTMGPGMAEPARGGSGGGAETVVAEGVPTAVLPDPRTVTGIRPGLRLRGLERRGFPVADWLCACGHYERARGRRAVIELNARATVGHCPHTTTQTRRSAA
ncbi:hypothetical protein OG337_18220 [[Kitasatospora] papulosa]|uniref:hypothetical protein n=1 Tax=[Kitasatospora] papulosa TaxID=1464011 RepID=UPI0038639D6A|nr:hypothetical protein OG337_18220 [[Kitasatospora] papulosa]